MNNKPVVIELPFWETIRRSFMYVLSNGKLYFKLSAVWFALLIYELFTGLPSLCNLAPDGCTVDWQHNVSLILLFLASVAIVIAYCRAVIIQAPEGYFNLAFGKREILYIVYNLAFVLLIAVPSVLIIFGFSLLASLLNLPDTYYSVAIVIPLFFAVYFSRVLLVFPAVAVDNREMSFKASFLLTAGNANRIFWGQLIMMIPVVLLMILVALVYQLLKVESPIIDFIFVAVIYALSFLDSCFKASFFSHIYQYFTYFRNLGVAQQPSTDK